jgi:predicted GIY-YIG superfamily endonuclease
MSKKDSLAYFAEIGREMQIERAHDERVGGYLYLIRSENDAYKIGITRHLKKRMEALVTASPLALTYLLSIPFETIEDAKELERELQFKYIRKLIRGEWYALLPEDIDYIKSLAR